MNLPINYNNIDYIKRREVRKEYAKIQGGKCYYCGNPLNSKPTNKILSMPIDITLFPYTFFKYPLHLHHNHKTGMTIGVVHNYCNAVLWQYTGE